MIKVCYIQDIKYINIKLYNDNNDNFIRRFVLANEFDYELSDWSDFFIRKLKWYL